jgi:ATP-dependent RNA helicase SUPV3L1/SUV3
MAIDEDVRSKARGYARLKLLWEIAQVPDFRKVRPEVHAQLLTQLFNHLTSPAEALPENWFAKQVERVNRTDGDMHVLMDRIAAVRSWTYIAHRGGWLKDAPKWQTETRRVEDRLSDALHDKLTTQFVDSRTAHLVKRLKSDDVMAADIDEHGGVEVDGHRLGQLDGLRFKAERAGTRTADRAVLNAASASLRPIISDRIDTIEAAEDNAFEFDDDAQIIWNEAPIAKLVAGAALVHPRVQIYTDDLMYVPARGRLEARLRLWATARIAQILAPLVKALKSDISGPVRGIVFQLSEGLGTINRAAVEEQLSSLKEVERKTLARLGIRFGVEHVFFPALLKAAPIRLRALLWIAAREDTSSIPLPKSGRVSIVLDTDVPRGFYDACGYRCIGVAGYRIDMLERFAAEARKLSRDKNPALPPDVLSLLGIDSKAGIEVLRGLGFKAELKEDKISFSPRKTRPKRHKTRVKSAPKPDSPFSKLAELKLS